MYPMMHYKHASLSNLTVVNLQQRDTISQQFNLSQSSVFPPTLVHFTPPPDLVSNNLRTQMFFLKTEDENVQLSDTVYTQHMLLLQVVTKNRSAQWRNVTATIR